MRTLACGLMLAAVAALGACGHHHHGAPCNQTKHAHLSVVRVDDSSDHIRFDDPSNYMKRAFLHSQAALDGPAAGVRIGTDSWTSDVNVFEPYFESPDRAAIERYVGSLEPTLVIPFDHRLAYQHGDRGWRTFYVNTTPILDERALATGEVHDGAARFELTAAAVKPFADATAEAAGHKLAFVVDGEVVSAPIVKAAIRGGTIEVTTSNAADAPMLVQRLGCSR